MRARTVVLFSLGLLLASSLWLGWLFPAVDDLWVENPFWNGLSGVYSRLQPARFNGFDGFEALPVNPVNSTILMLGPSSPFSEGEVATVKGYMEEGGRVVLTDDFGSGNSLLEGLGVGARFSGELLRDDLFKERRMMPRILFIEESSETVGVSELVFNHPTILEGVDASDVLGYASFSSTVGNSTVEVGPYPVLAVVGVGMGSLVLVSDSSIFINGMIERSDNMVLLDNLVTGDVIIDEAHSVTSRLTALKAFMTATYAFFSHPEVKYSLAAVLVVGIFRARWVDVDEEPDEVEEVLKRHPEWSRRELEELRDARRRARGLRDG